MNRDRVIAIGLLVILIMRLIPGDDFQAFSIGGFVGLVLGAVLGIAFVWGEWERDGSGWRPKP